MDTRPEPDFEAGRITHTVSVPASRHVTWTELTNPASIEQWWGHPADFPGGMREGARGTFEWVGHGLMPMHITRMEAPAHFDLLWGELGDTEPGENASPVHFTLREDGSEQTLLTVVESGFDRFPTDERQAALDENVKGWSMVLDSFVKYVEGRR